MEAMTLPRGHIHPVPDMKAAVLATDWGTSGWSAKKGNWKTWSLY